MHGHFKSKHKKNIFIYIKILIIILLIYVSFSLCYRLLFKKYAANISHEELINNIIHDSELEYTEETFFDKYLSLEYILKYTLDFEVKKEEPQVLQVDKDIPKIDNPKIYIYSTHDGEEYYDKSLENYNIVPNIKTEKYILADYLNDYNIETIIEDRSVSDILKQNGWSYSKSYAASKMLISDVINNNNFKLIIDLHRDSALKGTTTLEYNNKNYAKFYFIIGGENPNYENNLKIANKMNELVESNIPGISRGVSIKKGIGVNGIYNQDLSSNLILIELGGQYNEIEEINNSLEILSLSILKFLEGE